MQKQELKPRDVGTKREISQTLKRLMAEHRYTQSEASKLSGVAKSTLGDYIRGEVLPSRKNVEKLAKLFNVSLSEIDPRYDDDNTKELRLSPIEALKHTYSADGKPVPLEDIETLAKIIEQTIRANNG